MGISQLANENAVKSKKSFHGPDAFEERKKRSSRPGRVTRTGNTVAQTRHANAKSRFGMRSTAKHAKIDRWIAIDWLATHL